MSSIPILSFSLYSSSRLLIQLIQSKLNAIELTYPQYLVLATLWEQDGLKVNEIGKRLYLDSGTLTPLLKKLERMNYVRRSRSEIDERTVNIELTYPGKSLQSKAQKLLGELEETFEEMSSSSVNDLNNSLEGLLVDIESLKQASK
ncbi:MarR family winged helix-turn-helix transcriptional regulator [Algoriphagus halophytocola]|uniref:HTH-type transcriptional regulator SarZ n=1 Tax=Algoriphagus halophytocola TaxID=2991499 RepID=A0ABY6MDA1_9BACT|nr:MarR family transcriptional regulator [Algoriphagus sp. TR-M5]UZD21528.1 MarR family transcriptional regulator [Algoriphagus sp. TR-M5]